MKYRLLFLLLCSTLALSAQEIIKVPSRKNLLEVHLYQQNSQPKPLLLFLVGSNVGSSIKNYKDFVDFFLGDEKLRSQYSVAVFNKPGIGQSTGKWYNDDYFDRAKDAHNVAQYLMQQNLATEVHVVGHSQGGWIAQLALAQYPETFKSGVSMAGPTFSVKDQIIYDYYTQRVCGGMDSEQALKEAKKQVNRDLRYVSILGFKGNWKQLKIIKKYDPKPYLPNIKKPFLFMFANQDALVNIDWALERMEEVYSKNPPQNIETYIADNENHSFQKSTLCVRVKGNYSEKTREAITQWLTK